MNNLQNDRIAEHIWERLEYLYNNDKDFKDRICLAAEKAIDGFDKDYYSDMVDEYLMDLCDSMIYSLEESVPHFDWEIEEYAYTIAGIQLPPLEEQIKKLKE